MSAKSWIKRFFLAATMLAGGIYCLLYVLSFSYPLPVFNHVSLDAKLKFLNKTSRTTTADTVIVGSSVGVDNINGVLLEETSYSTREVLNYSAWGLNPVQVEQLLPVILDNRNIRRIIYAAQPGDFTRVDPLGNYDESVIRDYVYNTMSVLDRLVLLNKAANSFKSYWKTIRNWETKHQNKYLVTNLRFDRTGGVILKSRIKNIARDQRGQPLDYQKLDDLAFQALERIIQTVVDKNIRLYFTVQPQRQPPLEDDARLATTFALFDDRARKVVQSSQGVFINLHTQMGLGDEYFVDDLHLNEKGSSAVSEMLTSIIEAGP